MENDEKWKTVCYPSAEGHHVNTDELIQFDPILAKALGEAEENADSDVAKECLRELVAVSMRTGVEPKKIYAVIKTGRILTAENMKFLSKADIKEWSNACDEYDKLVTGIEMNSTKKRG